MRPIQVIIGGLALAAGAVVAVAMWNWTAPVIQAPQAGSTALDVTEVLVAAKDIPLGTKLESAALAWAAFPSAGLASTYVTRKAQPGAQSELAGTIARSSFFAGEPITAAKIVHTDRGFLSAILPSGMRAVATKIAADTSAGGFILPNDRVDLIMTRRQQGTGPNQPERFVTETVLSNVRVLAIDQNVEDKNGEKVVVGQTATLELSQQQAEILTVAQQMAERLTLALRSLADAQDRRSAEADAGHLLGGGKNGEVTVVKNGVSRGVATR